ncbi:MAG: hypothetical protein K6F92_08745 [Lachnospiraceae bacterium]|nr:hypothetical protein [Lachnospiraceae bacterium]
MAKRYYGNLDENSVAGSYRNYEYEYRYELDGNTVRRTAVPVEPDEEEYVAPRKPARRRTLTQEEQKKRQRATAFNLPTVVVITVFMVMAALACIHLVGAQGELNSHLRKVRELRSELTTVQDRNDLRYSQVEAGIDYTAIYDYAIKQLGMKQPGKDQVVWFNSTESEYVVQYEEIPQE